MMKFKILNQLNVFPFRRFKIRTQLKPGEILSRIGEFTEKVKLIRSPFLDESEHLPYQGYKIHNGFRIYRVLNYRNSFNPVIQGRFLETPEGTTVSVTVRAPKGTLVLLIIFLPVIAAITTAIWINSGFSSDLLILPGAILFMYMIFLAYFNSEYNDTLAFFNELLPDSFTPSG